jgi:dephospho-CoA kinase
LFTVGITGGIGTGKSTVCRIFNLLGISVFDADKEAKKLYGLPHIREQVIALFGEDVYSDSVLQREVLSAKVFSDPGRLTQLNELIHPAVQQAFERWSALQECPYVIKEAALLIESNSYKQLHHLIVVTCPLETRIRRVMQRDHSNRKAIMMRIERQMPEALKTSYADSIIRNDDTTMVIPQVLELHEKLIQLARRKS